MDKVIQLAQVKKTVTLEDLLIYNYLIAIILLMLKDLKRD